MKIRDLPKEMFLICCKHLNKPGCPCQAPTFVKSSTIRSDSGPVWILQRECLENVYVLFHHGGNALYLSAKKTFREGGGSSDPYIEYVFLHISDYSLPGLWERACREFPELEKVR